MIVSLLVTLTGMSSLHITRLSLATSQASDDQIIAEQMTRSAVEFAVNRVNNVSGWRTTYANDTENPTGGYDIGNGNFTFKFVDPDGDLADDDADGVWLTGIGRAGDATFVETVLLQPTGQPLSCLEASFHCNNDVSLSWLMNAVTDQFISSNGNITATISGSSVDGDAEAVGAITGTINGSSAIGITPRRMPSDTVFEYYLAKGTWIDASVLPLGGSSQPTIESVVLSPASNPYGTETNAEGIYVLDCGGQNVDVRNCRIAGTLVIVNPGGSTNIAASMYGKPAVANYPVLMVQGNIGYYVGNGTLDEAALGVNFNPAGTPFDGIEDADMSDAYPSRLTGLVYLSGKMTFSFSVGCDIRGCVVTEQVGAYSDFDIEYRATAYNYPPPGFAFGNPMRIAPGTWRRTSLP